jgi:Fe-S oxidoreductase/FAD/FMN-containing dehydrogenase
MNEPVTAPDIEKDLKAIAGDRATFSRFERWSYSSDILHLPGPVKALFKAVPAALVKPETVEQVRQVLAYCNQHKIPVVARGGGSSGLFAAVPKRDGVVLDMMDLNAVLEIDAAHETVTAQAGLTWWELEKRLNKVGLTLKSYPSSARSATLAGWAMTSGLGIGSLKYGPLSGQVETLEIVHADGSVRECGKDSARQFFETEGLLGIVTRLTIKVRRIPEKTAHYLVHFDDISNLFRAVQALAGHQPVPYTMEFFDDGYLSLLKAAGYGADEPAPGSGAILVTYDGTKSEIEAGDSHLQSVVKECHGAMREGAEAHWHERFDILRVRRAVPSLFPSSVYLPLEKLNTYFARQRKLHKRIAGTLGYVVSPEKCNLMPMVVTDERHPVEYAFSLHTPSSVSNLAISMGGKPGGGVGVWNTPYRRHILGNDGLERLKNLKVDYDANGILNPGMWLDPPPLFTPAVYRTAMLTASLVDKLLPAPHRTSDLAGFEKELAVCVQCGYCMNYCPTRLDWLSTTPRGRILATRELFLRRPQAHRDFSAEFVSRLYQCTMCGRCGVDCSTDIKSRAMWLGVRRHLAAKGLVPDSLKELVKLVDEHRNIAGRPNDQRANWLGRAKLPYDLKGKRAAPVVYFVGCVASFFPMTQPSARAFAQILNRAGVDFAIAGGEEWCCGFPLMVAGDKDASRKLIQHNLERMKDMGAQTIVMTCPGCYKVWKHEYEEIIEERHPFTVLHSTEFMASLMGQGKLKTGRLEAKATYHDPCDLGRNAGLYDEPRYILGRIPGLEIVELESNREYCTCCGSGGDLLASNKDMSLAIAGRKVAEITATGAATAVTACPSCIRAITMAKTAEKAKLEVLDITEVLWKVAVKGA